jgi:DNA-binding SARP family transcriptional activator
MIECRTLGPVKVTLDGREAPAELLWRKNLALLVYLALSPRHTRGRDHLIGLLWPDAADDKAARHSLRESVRVLRRCAGKQAIQAHADQVQLDGAAVRVDVAELEELIGRGDWHAAADLIAGEFLEGFGVPGASGFEDWLASQRSEWRQRAVQVLVRAADQSLATGELARATALARRAVMLEPGSGDAARSIMTCLALIGDREGALEEFESLCRRLEELGAQPDRLTEDLVERIRHERRWRVPERGVASAGRGAESRRAPLVGRGVELERLVSEWNACRRKRRPALGIVEGDPGTGKTRVGHEMLARARLDGAATGEIRAVQADREHPWSGLLGLARSGLLEAPGAAATPPPSLAVLAAHIPEWQDRFPAVKPAGDVSLLGRAISDLLRAIAVDHPVCVLVDDAQALDRESLLALEAVLRDLANASLLLIICTTLGGPSHPRPEIDELRARLGRDLRGCVVRLGPLPPEHVRTLCEWALPGFDDQQLDRLGRRIQADSAGLPLLVVELLHAVALGLDLADTTSVWPAPLRTLDHTFPSDLPPAVVGAIRVGVRRLSQDAQRVLVAAAVLGDRVPREQLAAVSGLDGDALNRALDELEWERWLVADPRGYSFLARVVRDVIAQDLVTPGQRQRLQRAAEEVR